MRYKNQFKIKTLKKMMSTQKVRQLVRGSPRNRVFFIFCDLSYNINMQITQTQNKNFSKKFTNILDF